MPTDSTNQTTEYTYDGSNHVTSMTAVMPSGEYSQTTTYVYGVTTLTGSDIDSNDLLYAVEYPNPANGSSGSQFIFNHVDYGGSGVTGNSSGYTEGDPNAPQGSQVAFIQGPGQISQSVEFSAGTYKISFEAIQRAGYSAEGIEVLVDGNVVWNANPSSGSYTNYNTASFTVTAGMHTVTFLGIDPTLGDRTAFIDNIQISNVGGGSAPTLADAGFEAPSAGSGTYWAFDSDPGYTQLYDYDALGEQTSYTDQNGTDHAYTYDALGRLTADSVVAFGYNQTLNLDTTTVGIGYSYNDAGLLYQTTSYGASSTVLNQTEDLYNGLGQLATEYQAVSGSVNTSTTPSVQYGYNLSAGAVQSSLTYPNGRAIDYNYNVSTGSAPGVISSISDSSGNNIQSYQYQGLDTPLQANNGNGVVSNTTLDNFGRTSSLVYTNSSGGTIDGYSYGYDADGNVLFDRNAVLTGDSQLYAYDNLNRLTNYSAGTLNTAGTAISGTPTETEGWNLNAIGDWNSSTLNGTTTNRNISGQNQVTSIGTSSLSYDADGNTLTSSVTGQTYVYDAWNRLVTVKNSSGGTIASYTYDGLDRRITETNSGTTTASYYSSAGQILEQRQSGTTIAQFVWGLFYVNQLVQQTTSAHGTQYVEQDADWNITSLSDTSGTVVERYSFGPYGMRTIMNASGGVITSSAYGTIFGYQGGYTDPWTGLTGFGIRWVTAYGTWLTEDPTGGMYVNGADLYQLEMSNTIGSTDSSGLEGAVDTNQPTWNPWSGWGSQWLGNILSGGTRFDNVKRDTQFNADHPELHDQLVRSRTQSFGAATQSIVAGVSTLPGTSLTGPAVLPEGTAGNAIDSAANDALKVAAIAKEPTTGWKGFWLRSVQEEEPAAAGTTREAEQNAANNEEKRVCPNPNGTCFLPGTLVLSGAGKLIPIEHLRIGCRVASAAGVSSFATIDPSLFRVIRLEFVEHGRQILISYLRPLAVVADLAPGDTVQIDQMEVEARGRARVLSVEPCPPLEDGPGHLVTAVYSSDAIDLRSLKLSGLAEPIGVTGSHPIYSEDRQDFVTVNHLREGEKLRTRDGLVRVESITRLPGRYRVFNLEIGVVHQYYVSESLVLVHNENSGNVTGQGGSNAANNQPPLSRLHPDSTLTGPGNASSYNYWSKQPTPDIIDSLKPGSEEPLTVDSNGKVWQGNTRIKILQDRGVDVNSLPRVPK